MHQITSAQFRATIELDPAWASKLTEPVEITDFCDMQNSKITHLSPLLHFTGKNLARDCANFRGCNSLEIAEGTFGGFVSFRDSGIKKIGDITCGKNENGSSAYFSGCESLKIAEGNFEGWVDFSESGIEQIGDLTCGKNWWGIRLDITDCPKLQSIPLTFSPKEIEADPKLIEKLKVDRFIRKKRAEIVEVVI